MNLLASAKVHNTANVAKEHYKTRSKPLLPSFLLPSIFSNSANEHYLYAILTFSFSRVLILIWLMYLCRYSLAMPKMQQAVLSQLPKRRKKDERLARLFSRFLKNLKRPPTVKNPANSNPFQISFFFPRFLSTFFFSPTESRRASVPSLG